MAATLEQLAQGLRQQDTTDAVWRRHNSYARNAQGQIIALSRSEDEALESVVLDAEAAALEYLYLAGNAKLRELRFAAPLPRLVQLNVSECMLDRPVEIPAGCEALRQIYFRKNKLSALLFSGSYPALQLIDAGDNDLKTFELPKDAPLLEHLYLKGNESLESPPAEIAAQGSEALLAWYAASKKALREIKVLLVGEAKAGKTSVLRRLKNNSYNPSEVQTDGILIEELDFERLDTFKAQSALHGIKAYFWDFGGQEIMSSTHQFFMTKRSVYLLILEARRDADPNQQVRDWLKRIQAFGGHSQVIIAVNKIELNRSFGLDMYNLQTEFPQVKACIHISCDTGEKIDDLKDLLAEYIPQAELCNSQIDEYWIAVKEALQRITREDHYIAQRQFKRICEQCGLPDPARQKEAVTFLHDLGILLHFDDLDLGNFFVLDPYWVTSGVYRIITSETAATQEGKVGMAQLDYIVNREPRKQGEYVSEAQQDLAYEGAELRYLADILVQFKLGYYTNNRQSILIPDLLPRQTPAEESDALLRAPEKLRLQYRYDYLPPAVLPRFMVEMQHDIHIPWRTGVILKEKNGTQVQAMLSAAENKIQILVVGEHKRKREYLSVIRHFLDKINAEFNIQWEVLLPLPGHEGHFVEYDTLREMEKAGRTVYEYWKLKKEFVIAELLEGIRPYEDIRREGADLLTRYGSALQKHPPLMYGIKEELEGLHETLRLLIEKKNMLQQELAIAYDVEKKFALERQIEKIEKDLVGLRGKAGELETKMMQGIKRVV
jgi:internalin A